MRALLDVNALIALLDEEHVQHAQLLDWLRSAENLPHGFATCAITQLGAIRVMTGKGYYKPFATAEVAEQIDGLTRKGHRYLGIPAPSEGTIRWKNARSSQATDATLLSTAVAHGCRLVTFDAGIPLTSVTGATKEHLVVLGKQN
jgi:toxin-antitoxin system PIN domain toxin